METGLSPEEQISLLGDEWAQVRANKVPVGSYLDLVAAVKGDSSGEVLRVALGPVGNISAQLASTNEERSELAAWIRKTFKPELDKMGTPSANDTPEQQERRATIFWTLGTVGHDPDVIAQARTIAEKYLVDAGSVDATLAESATSVAAINGDAAFFDQLQKVYETSENPDRQEGALMRLAAFQDPTLEKRALDYTLSGKVRNQDSPHMLASPFRSPATRDLAWQYIQANWDKVTAQLTKWSASELVGATGSFCSAESRDQVVAFFSAHKVVSSERELKRTVDQINDCIEFRSDQEGNLKEWLARQQ